MFQPDHRNITALILLGLLVILALAEMRLSYLDKHKYYEKRDTLTNIYLATITFFINIGFKGATFFLLDYFYKYRLFQIKSTLLYWLTLIILQDFLYWLLHYTGHYCRLFWAIHVTHHSSPYFNLSTGFRSTVFEPLYRVFFYLPLAIFGFKALDIIFAYLVTQLYGNLVHTQYNIKFPKWYSWLFVTPSHHRVHHGSNIPYLDKNMGMVLILWDRLFGTFRAEDLPEPVTYGLTKQPEKLDAVNVIFHEWKAMLRDVKKAPGLKAKLGYIFNAPGWSHDASTNTARQLQKQYQNTSGQQAP